MSASATQGSHKKRYCSPI